jgi:hypothetical protein
MRKYKIEYKPFHIFNGGMWHIYIQRKWWIFRWWEQFSILGYTQKSRAEDRLMQLMTWDNEAEGLREYLDS